MESISPREQILQTTSQLLETQGYHGTGLNQIIKESGSPKGSLYYYFPEGKKEIAAEAIRHSAMLTAQRIQANLDTKEDWIESLRIFSHSIAHHIEQSDFRAGGPLQAVAVETAATDEYLNTSCRNAYETLRLPFEEKLLAGGFTPDQAASYSMLILTMLEGAILISRTYHNGGPLRQTGDELAKLLRSIQPANA